MKAGIQREVTEKSYFEAAKAGQQLQQKRMQLRELFSPKAQKKVVILASQCHFQTRSPGFKDLISPVSQPAQQENLS